MRIWIYDLRLTIYERVRRNFALVGIVALGLGSLFLNGCGQHSEPTASTGRTLYTCGMHPQVIQDKPGLCPICGMKLTPCTQATRWNQLGD